MGAGICPSGTDPETYRVQACRFALQRLRDFDDHFLILLAPAEALFAAEDRNDGFRFSREAIDGDRRRQGDLRVVVFAEQERIDGGAVFCLGQVYIAGGPGEDGPAIIDPFAVDLHPGAYFLPAGVSGVVEIAFGGRADVEKEIAAA